MADSIAGRAATFREADENGEPEASSFFDSPASGEREPIRRLPGV
jgi:hypothetical protein